MIETIKKIWDNSGREWSEREDYEWIVAWMTTELNRHAWEPVSVSRDVSECLYYSSAEFMGYENIHLLDNRLCYTMSNGGHEDEEDYKVTVWFNTITDAVEYWQDHIQIPIRVKDITL